MHASPRTISRRCRPSAKQNKETKKKKPAGGRARAWEIIDASRAESSSLRVSAQLTHAAAPELCVLLALHDVPRTHEGAVRDVQEIGDFTHEVLFVMILAAVRIGHAPHHFNDLYFLFGGKLLVHQLGELKQRHRLLGLFLGDRDELGGF